MSGGCKSVTRPHSKRRDEPALQALHFAGGPVAGQDNLLVRFVQRVERVEKFLLDALLAGEKLDVVNQQHVRLAIFFAECGELVVLKGVNVFVGEFFRGNIGDARAFWLPTTCWPMACSRCVLPRPTPP